MKTIKILILTSVLLLTSVSCKKFVEDYYVDPNGITYTVADQEMTAMMLQNQFFQKADGMRMAMMWMNQATGAKRQYLSLDNWNNATGDEFNGPWNEVYLTASHADIVTKMAEKDGNITLRGLGKLYKAWAGGEAASLWGDVPFSQINNFDKYPDPKYDKQAKVFEQVQSLLDDAIVDLSSGNGKIDDKRDFYFEGNVWAWIKIAHGLKARFYLHAKKYDLAKQEAAQGPSSVSDDMYAKFDSNNELPFGQWNPTVQFEVSRGDMNASEAWALKKLLASSGPDSRKNSKTIDKRKEYNYTGKGLNTTKGTHETGKFYGDMPLLTYGEMLLIQTEATLRDTSNANRIDDALNFYNKYRALLTNGEYAGGYDAGNFQDYAATDFAPGGIENDDNIDQVKAFFRELFEERYVFFIGDYESFIDFARSFNDDDVPQYMKLHYDFSDGKPKYEGQPLRFIYPQNDKDANANFPGMKSIDTPLPLYQ